MHLTTRRLLCKNFLQNPLQLLAIVLVVHHQHLLQVEAVASTSFDVCSPDNHRFLGENWRYHDWMSKKEIKTDDTELVTGWYRFINSSHRMLERDELFPDLTTKNRSIFRPSGSEPFQTFRFFPLPPRLFVRTTPIYVLQGQHPTVNGEFSKMEAVECYYETILNVFGTGALPAGSGICDLKDPYRQNCTFLHHCEEAQRVQIMVHHCGSFYVYRLTAVRDLKSNKFFVARKGGLYCGSKDAHVPVSAPCKCQLSEENEEILEKSSCNVEYKETLEESQIKESVACLETELNSLVHEDQIGAACVNKLWSAEHGNKMTKKKTNNDSYEPHHIKEQQKNCYDLRRLIKDAIATRFDRLRPFLKNSGKNVYHD